MIRHRIEVEVDVGITKSRLIIDNRDEDDFADSDNPSNPEKDTPIYLVYTPEESV